MMNVSSVFCEECRDDVQYIVEEKKMTGKSVTFTTAILVRKPNVPNVERM